MLLWPAHVVKTQGTPNSLTIWFIRVPIHLDKSLTWVRFRPIYVKKLFPCANVRNSHLWCMQTHLLHMYWDKLTQLRDWEITTHNHQWMLIPSCKKQGYDIYVCCNRVWGFCNGKGGEGVQKQLKNDLCFVFAFCAPFPHKVNTWFCLFP